MYGQVEFLNGTMGREQLTWSPKGKVNPDLLQRQASSVLLCQTNVYPPPFTGFNAPQQEGVMHKVHSRTGWEE